MAVGDGRRHSLPPSCASVLIHLKVASRSAPAGTPCLRTDSQFKGNADRRFLGLDGGRDKGDGVTGHHWPPGLAPRDVSLPVLGRYSPAWYLSAYPILILVLLGLIPAWPHSRSWGYYPAGGIGVLVLILVILLVLGRI